MYYDIIETEEEIKSSKFKNWCIEQFEKMVGEFPEIEKPIEKETSEKKEKRLLKKHRILRYSIFPIVFILIIIDESYLRIRDSIKKIDESE